VWDVVQNRIAQLRDHIAAILEASGIPNSPTRELKRRGRVSSIDGGKLKVWDEHSGQQ
jgi:hypothetical protein